MEGTQQRNHGNKRVWGDAIASASPFDNDIATVPVETGEYREIPQAEEKSYQKKKGRRTLRSTK